MRKIFSCLLLLCVAFVSRVSAQAISIVDEPIVWTEERMRLTEEYAMLHYGFNKTTITPQAVVVHWTASGTFESVYYHFLHEERDDGTLNVASHFVVDRDGTIYRLTPENALNRHAIGYNWCAIGIENVGGVDNEEDLTPEQLAANLRLIRYLYGKYPTIQYIFGHYQQDEARESGLYIEHVEGYRSEKSDPGPIFMRGLREGLQDTPLVFFPE